ncbi:Elongator complex protein 4 [Multifurca ochricompacta]|uniref:Elongator complex protein 4 n=1 Tax=Multifurca ochricompacta TaxID=376703 RepID=A0AAD4MDF5_9AGAM|nr:Elongator complex protein 4 [Multifurca ochricompacta]
MSTFKRKKAKAVTVSSSSETTVNLLPGTRLSPFSSSTILTSSGIASLDDILGGGLPLSCSLLVIAPDIHSSYGELVQKYFISQGLASGQKLCVIDDEPERFISECMWFSNGNSSSTVAPPAEDEDDSKEIDHDTNVNIAWRYEHLTQFQTTVSASKFSTDEFCRPFDLTYKVPGSFLDQATKSSQVVLLKASSDLKRVIDVITESLRTCSQEVVPVRICIPLLGSPGWGDLKPKEVLNFVYLLRTVLRQYPHGCASVGLRPSMSGDGWGGPGWLNKLSWLFDGSVTLAGFSADPSLSLTFPSHHGSFHIHRLPAPYSLRSASDRSSTLRGVSSVSGLTGGAGENNLAFKCTRRRLVIETHHLDVEGGVGERRTATAPVPLPVAVPVAVPIPAEEKEKKGTSTRSRLKGTGIAAMPVELEEKEEKEKEEPAGLHLKMRKKVTFRAEQQPDLYDF